MNYNTLVRTVLSVVVLSCLIFFAMCDDDDPVVVEPPIDGTIISAWRIDTLSGLHLRSMIVLDTNRIVMGGDAFGNTSALLELNADTIISWDYYTTVRDLASASKGFFSIEKVFPGGVFHNHSGIKTRYKCNDYSEEAWSIYRYPDNTYLVGFVTDGIARFDGVQCTKDTVSSRLDGNSKYLFYTDFAQYRDNNYATAFYYINDGAEEKGYLLKETSARRWEYIDSCHYTYDEAFSKPHFGSHKLFAAKDGVLFSIGAGGAFRMRDDESWESLVRMDLGFSIGGTSSKDMYFGSNNGHFYYYDGTVVKEIIIPTLTPHTVVAEIVVLGRKVYVLTHNYRTDLSFLLRGER